MNDFKFTKAIMNRQTTTDSKFNTMTDIDKIQRIHDNMETMFKKTESKQIEVVKQDNNDMFRNRINALNNIKKD